MIQFRLFGPLELRNGRGTQLHSVLAHSKQTALLTYLAVGRSGLHRRDRLTALFWPDLDAARARNALSKALHHLRRALGDDAFVVRGNEELGLESSRWCCDVTAFVDAVGEGDHAAALALYDRGELLDGFHLADASEFDQWLERQRHQMRQLAVGSAASLSRRAEDAGDLVSAVEWASKACDLAPHDEVALRRRLFLLQRTGNRAAAISAYQSFARILERDLGAQPSDQTRGMVDSFREDSWPLPSGDPVKNPTAAANQVSPEIVEPLLPAVDHAGTLPFHPASTTSATGTPSRGWTSSIRFRVAALVLVAISTTLAMIELGRPRGRQGASVVGIGRLDNRTGDTRFDLVAELARGGIIQQLSQSTLIDVVDLEKLGRLPLPWRREAVDAGRAAGAATVVSGEMYRKADSLVVQAQIVNSADGHVTYQLDPVAVPAANAYLILDRLRDEVGGAVAALTDTMYLPWSTAHSHPPKYAAFQEFMQGLDAVVHQGVTSAVEHLQRAIALDTGFVEAKIWFLEEADMLPGRRKLVDSVRAAAIAQRSRLGAFDQLSLDREIAFLDGHLEDTYTAARRLVALAPMTPDAYAYLAQAAMATRRYAEALEVLHHVEATPGWLKDLPQLKDWDLQAHRLNGDVSGGLAEWRRMRTQSPQDFGLCRAGILLLASAGRERNVEALINDCARLPQAPPVMDRAFELAGRGFSSTGETAAARRAFERVLELRTKAATANPRSRRGIGYALCELGNWHQAYAELRASADTSDDDDHVTLAVAAAHVGDTATVNRTLRWINRWPERGPPRGADKLARAFILLAAGDRERALNQLRLARDEGAAPAWTAWYVRFELQPLRGDPRFEELIRPQS